MTIASLDQAQARLTDANLANNYPFLARLGEKLVAWYQKKQTTLPWRELWAEHRDPYHVWVSEVMLQQTLIKVVIPKYLAFLQRFPDPISLSKAAELDVKEAVRGLGYYRRFSFLHKAAIELCAPLKSGQKVLWPANFLEWKKLPGVGEYTAAAVSSITLGEAVPVVDGNVERVLSRIFDIRLPANIPQLKKIFFQVGLECLSGKAAKRPGDFNQGLMELGQTLCLPSTPLCRLCPIASHCQAKKNLSQGLSPAPKVKPVGLEVKLTLTIVKYRKQFGLKTRSEKAKFLKGIPGFITDISHGKHATADGHELCLDFAKRDAVGQLKHSITRHKITANVFLTQVSKKSDTPDMNWYTASELEGRLVSNLDRKAWKIFLKNSDEI